MITRRRPRVTARAAAGALLMAAAAVIVFAGWLGTSGRQGRLWVVARVPVAAGARITYGDLSTAHMTLPEATGAAAFSAPGALVGRTLAAPLTAGELIQTASLVPAGTQPLLRPVAVSVDPSDASVLSVGGLVDVLVTDGSDPSSPTAVVVRGARVISVAQPAGGFAGGSTGPVVTIGVRSLSEVTAIVHAEHTGTLSVVVGEASDGSGLGAGAGPTTGPTSGPTTSGAGPTSGG